jgi:ABC-type Zn uptake system ZnuABC Zn-binding protein ZnuA
MAYRVHKKRLLAVFAVAILVVAGLIAFTGVNKDQSDGRLNVVASFYPLYYFSSQIGGDRANVHALVPDNTEPHAWEPRPSDLIKVQDSQIFVYNGAGFEPWITDFLGEVNSPNLKIVDTSANVALLLSDTVKWPYDQAELLLSNGPNLTATTSSVPTASEMVELVPSVININLTGSAATFESYLRMNLTTPDDFRFFVTDAVEFELQFQNGSVLPTEMVIGFEDLYPEFNNSKFYGLENFPAGIYYLHLTSTTDQTRFVIVQGSGGSDGGGEGHKHGLNDPHFWIDPISAKVQVENILQAFKVADPTNADYYQANADDMQKRLDALDQAFSSGLQDRTKNEIITTHEGFNYMAQRYHFEAYGAIGISGDQQPSAKDMADLTELVDRLGLKYVYSEPIFSDSVIQTIATETHTTLLVLDGAHGRTGVHANMDYFEIMYANLESLKIGLEVSNIA